jgi:hypothetical protein
LYDRWLRRTRGGGIDPLDPSVNGGGCAGHPLNTFGETPCHAAIWESFLNLDVKGDGDLRREVGCCAVCHAVSEIVANE